MKIRIYYEDTDCGNIVYYANYLKYMERSRTEYLRERGINLQDLQQGGLLFAVGEVKIKYRHPAVYNDLIDVTSKIIEHSTRVLTFETKIYNEQRTLLTSGTAKLVCISTPEMKAQKIPQDLLDALL